VAEAFKQMERKVTTKGGEEVGSGEVDFDGLLDWWRRRGHTMPWSSSATFQNPYTTAVE
jgi:hypothetical protein